MATTTIPGRVTERNRTRDYVLWGVSLAFATKLGSAVLSLVLARLIAPEMFGQYGTVSTILLFTMSFSMQPFAEHLFFKEALTSKEYHQHLSFGMLIHLALFLIANAIAAAMWFDPILSQVALYLHIASLAILLNVPRILYATHLRFELRWKALRLLGAVSFLLYAVVSVTLAMRGYGVLSLLSQNLVVPLPYVVAYFFESGTLRGLDFDWRAYRPSFDFGLLRTASGVLGTAYQAVEGLAFSLTVGYNPLGLFNRARGLSVFSGSWFSDQLRGLLLPSLAKLKPRSDAARQAAGLLLRAGVWTNAPIAVAVAMADKATVHVLFGDQWSEAVPLIRPVLLAALAGSGLGAANLVLLTSKGARSTLSLDAIGFGTNLVGLLTVVVAGSYAYALYLAAATTALLIAVFGFLIRQRLLDSRDLVKVYAPMVILAVVGLFLARQEVFQHAEHANPFLTMAASGGASAVGTLLLIRLIDPAGLRTICGLLPGGRWTVRWLMVGIPS
jgi:O-antigen/teichoic acid export membrane protein